MTLAFPRRLLLLAPLLACLLASRAEAQRDSVVVVAGASYEAGGLQGMMLGTDYRDLWTAPIRVPVLDLDAFAGGITPVERGSGLQTISLRFRAKDGVEYNFRSVEKNQTGGLHPDFQNTTVDRVVQDQVSSKHPVGALIADPLLEAAGVLHPAPRLYVMPDDARLGEFRETFAGMLGTIEVHPNEGENDTPGFANAERVADSETLLEHLEESAEHRADSREFLRARLMDIFLGDWDRHLGQWRWARFERDGTYWWVPVPEDRDNAFSSFDGVMPRVVRAAVPHLNEFRASYPPLYGMVRNAQQLDREILSDLPREAFDEMGADLQRRLTDAVIDDAVARTPPELAALRGEELSTELRARRDALPAIARAFYVMLAREVDVHGTDEVDRAEAEMAGDGTLRLTLLSERDGAWRPYFTRQFLPGETREVRVYLRGGNDEGIVRGSGGSGVKVLLIGGGGDDRLVDSTTGGGGRVAFYDDRGDNSIEARGSTVVDTREFEEPEAPDSTEVGFNENAPRFRDWGREVQWFRPWADWRYNVGPVIGGGPQVVRYGFRRVPYARRFALRGLYAPFETRFGVELEGDIRHTNSPSRISIAAHATQLDVTRFHGFGNDTPDEGSSDLYKVWETEYMVTAAYHRLIGPSTELFAGPLVRYTRPDLEEGGPADMTRPFGSEPYGQVGARAGALIDTRDLPGYPRHGVRAEVEATAFPGIWDAPEAFGGVDGRASTYLPIPFPLETTLAVRAGGSLAWGEYPFQEAAFLGGGSSLRGTPRQRFAGDAAAWAGAELRAFLTRFNFISRGDFGVIALADAGRVFVDDDSSDRIHTGFGGGIWVGILDRSRTASLVFASGTEEALYFNFGMPF